VRMEPRAELGVGGSQGLMVHHIFGNLAQDQGHAEENKNPGDEMQTKISFYWRTSRHAVFRI
jgi:hypothetical protein